MRAAVFDAFRAPLEVRDLPDPACPRDGVIVEVRACGVCRSDWHAWSGADPDVSAPHVPGHELAGVIAEVGPDCRRWVIGARVTAPFILGCGSCAACAGGNPTVCSGQHVIGFSGFGAFAERIAVPRADFNLVALPQDLSFVDAAGMGCRVTTAFRALVERARLMPGEWLAVHGCGGVGLAAIKIATALGAGVVAVDVSEDALALAADFGANVAINPHRIHHVGEAVRDVTGGGAHVAVDALGITATFHDALAGLRPMGRMVQIGMPTGPHATPEIPLLDLIYARQLSLHGTRGMAASGFAGLFAMIAAGRLSLNGLVTRRIALRDAGAALAEMDATQAAGVTVIDRFQ